MNDVLLFAAVEVMVGNLVKILLTSHNRHHFVERFEKGFKGLEVEDCFQFLLSLVRKIDLVATGHIHRHSRFDGTFQMHVKLSLGDLLDEALHCLRVCLCGLLLAGHGKQSDEQSS